MIVIFTPRLLNFVISGLSVGDSMGKGRHDLLKYVIDGLNTLISTDPCIVSSPDPAPKREKGLVYIEPFLGPDDVAFLNSVAPIRVAPCDYIM